MLPSQMEKITAKGVRGMILAALDTGSNSWVSDVAMTINSDSASENYGWLGNAPALREFIGGRTPKELRENGFSITNKDFETSIVIQSKDARRDKLGMIQIRVNQLAERVLDHPAKLLSALLMSGASALCYDGQYFFDTDHVEGDSGTQSNSISVDIVAPATPTVDEFTTGVMKGIQTIYGFKDDQGEPINQNAARFQVQVPVAYLGVALEAVNAMLGTGGKSNTLDALKRIFTIEVVPNPRLTWTDKFVVIRIDSAAKPFILQEEVEQEVVALGEGSEYEKINKQHLYGVDWTGNVGFGFWQHAVLVTFT